jgi:hypothetical protein
MRDCDNFVAVVGRVRAGRRPRIAGQSPVRGGPGRVVDICEPAITDFGRRPAPESELRDRKPIAGTHPAGHN